MTQREARELERRRRIESQQAEVARRVAGIADCSLCDSDGYTATLMVCDHVDRKHTYQTGSSLVRTMMGWTQGVKC